MYKWCSSVTEVLMFIKSCNLECFMQVKACTCNMHIAEQHLNLQQSLCLISWWHFVQNIEI